MTKLSLNSRIIRKERFNNNKLKKKKKNAKIKEFTTLFKIDNYEKTDKDKNNPVYLNILAFNNLASYIYRKNIKGKKARIYGRLINYYNNNNNYIGNYVEINRIKTYKA